MGTLTADVPRLAAHCDHKLPTSCRLTSTLLCCACADQRQHTATYSVYIDGVGFVQRGTRWQSYCWFCKEFWNNRIAVYDPPFAISQTRIPEVPDQSDFVKRWFEFHQGWREEDVSSTTSIRHLLQFEPWRDVSPGHLPRTLDEIRRGVSAEAVTHAINPTQASADESEEPSLTMDDFLDGLLDGPSGRGNTPEAVVNIEPRIPQPDETILPASTLQPEARTFLPPTRQPIWRFQDPATFTTREFPGMLAMQTLYRLHGGSTPPPTDEEPVSLQGRSTHNESLRPDQEAQRQRLSRRPAPLPLRINPSPPAGQVERDVSRVRQRRQTIRDRQAESITQTFGTREDVQRDDYQSPIAGLYNQAYVSYQRAEEHRRDYSNAQALLGHSESHRPPTIEEDVRAIEEIERRRQLFATHGWQTRGPYLETVTMPVRGVRAAEQSPWHIQPPGTLESPDRPLPVADDEMNINMQCHICYQQLSDTAVLPCGHMVMCRWCADAYVPGRPNDRTTPAEEKNCPKCRRRIKRRLKIIYG